VGASFLLRMFLFVVPCLPALWLVGTFFTVFFYFSFVLITIVYMAAEAAEELVWSGAARG